MDKTPKYLKTFEDVVTSSLGGRDDGYSETKYECHTSIESLSRGFGTKQDEKYYSLEPIASDDIATLVSDALEDKRQRDIETKKVQLANNIAKMQSELKALE